MSEGEVLILKKKSTENVFDKTMANKSGKGFPLDTRFYNIANVAAILSPYNLNLKEEAAIHPEGVVFKKKEQATTKQIATRKIHANEIQAKLNRPVEDRM